MNGWQNVVENDGLTIAIAGMVVVFSALAVISLFIALLPSAMKQLHRIAPEREDRHAAASPPANPPVTEDESVAAAIGFAMHLHGQQAKAN